MNRSKKQKLHSKKIKNLILLCVEKNLTTINHTICFEFHGNVNKIEILFFRHGWREDRFATVRFVFSLDVKVLGFDHSINNIDRALLFVGGLR